MHSKLFQHNFHLDPAPDGAAGGAAAAGSPSGSDAAPAFDASAFESKFESRLNSEIERVNGEWQNRYQELEGRLPQPPKQEPKADAAPSAKDYDFTKDGEFERFLDDRNKFNLKQELTQREASWNEQQEAKEREARAGEIESEAKSRDDAYMAANPEYLKDVRNADLKFHRPVGLAIQDSEYSAQIKHYLAKNPAKVAELRSMASKSKIGIDAAVRMIGRIEAQFENKAAPAIPSARPTRGAFGGGGAKPTARDPLEVVKEWRM